MNKLMETNNQQTMTSREIAELVESRHDHVKTSIERLVKNGVISTPSMRDYVNDINRTYQEYVICKRDTYVIVAQLSPAFTARLVDRWQELEEQAKNVFAIPKTYSEALRLAADTEERNIELQQNVLLLENKVEKQTPAVEFVEKYVESNGSKGFREVCKLLNAKEPMFREFLVTKKIMYQLGGKGNWTPYSEHIDTGRFDMKTGVTMDGGYAYSSAKFTPKGITWIAGEWAKFNVKAKLRDDSILSFLE